MTEYIIKNNKFGTKYKCKKIQSRKIKNINCLNCNKTFLQNRKERKFCCKQCSDIYRKTTHKEIKECINCRKLFNRPQRTTNKNWEQRKFCSKKCQHKYLIGNKSPLWKGGLTTESTKFRRSKKYKDFVKQILQERNFTCELTNIKGCNLNVHHLQSINTHKNLAFKDNNVVLISEVIHKLFHKIYGRGNNTKEQYLEFKNKLCKKCKSNIRKSLYFCEDCLNIHCKQTRELKRKYRAQCKCVMCGQDSNGKRLCKNCYLKQRKYVKDSLYIQSKKSKTGVYGKLEQIMEIV